jgi:hypothetical protein
VRYTPAQSCRRSASAPGGHFEPTPLHVRCLDLIVRPSPGYGLKSF